MRRRGEANYVADGESDGWAAGTDADPVGTRSPGEESISRGHEAVMRRVAREQVVRGWEEVGVNFGEFKERQEHAKLLEWIRSRKANVDAGWSKAMTTAVGAVISAAVAGLIAYLTGGHR